MDYQFNNEQTFAFNTETGVWHNIETSIEYTAWLEAGNTPEPAPEPVAPVELTPAEKLAASGLTVEELKSLLGLT